MDTEIITCNSEGLVHISAADSQKDKIVEFKTSQHNGRVVNIHPFLQQGIVYTSDSYGRLNAFGRRMFHDVGLNGSRLFTDLTTDDWSD